MKAIWMDSMGGPTVEIDVSIGWGAHKVFVDGDTLIEMAFAVAKNGPAMEKDNIGAAGGLLSIEPDEDGRYDVTEAGGGFQHWLDDFIDEPTEPVYFVCALYADNGSIVALGAFEQESKRDEVLALLRTSFQYPAVIRFGTVIAPDEDTAKDFARAGRWASAEDENLPDRARPYFDHDGQRTDDPRCELGFCVECIDDALARGFVLPLPALSTHDPRYLSDGDYRAKVVEALAKAGVTLREAQPA